MNEEKIQKLSALALEILMPKPSDGLAKREAIWLAEAALKRHSNLAKARELLEAWAKKRATGYPLAYILGSQPFHEIELKVHEGVLVPRPETEEMVEIILRDPCIIRNRMVIGLDLGCGSGCLALALGKALPNSRWVMTDISKEALEVARGNASALDLSDNVTFRLGNWWDALENGPKFDIIVTNPPYVGTEEEIDKGATFEPPLALYAGKDGLDAYREIFPHLKERLHVPGLFYGECGPFQGEELLGMAKAAGFDKCEIIQDRQGRNRYLRIEYLGSGRWPFLWQN